MYPLSVPHSPTRQIRRQVDQTGVRCIAPLGRIGFEPEGEIFQRQSHSLSVDIERTAWRRRVGVGASGLIVACTGFGLLQAYRLWQYPPPYVASDLSSGGYAVALAGAADIFLVVGLYLALNAYRWSTAGNSAE